MKQTSLLCLGIGLMVGACQPKAKPTQPEDETPKPLIVHYSCRGTEPFWLLDIYADSIVYLRAGEEKVIYPAVQAVLIGDTTSFSTQTKIFGEASNMTIKIVADSCSDGMSEELYPFTALVSRNEELLRGCAFDRSKK